MLSRPAPLRAARKMHIAPLLVLAGRCQVAPNCSWSSRCRLALGVNRTGSRAYDANVRRCTCDDISAPSAGMSVGCALLAIKLARLYVAQQRRSAAHFASFEPIAAGPCFPTLRASRRDSTSPLRKRWWPPAVREAVRVPPATQLLMVRGLTAKRAATWWVCRRSSGSARRPLWGPVPGPAGVTSGCRKVAGRRRDTVARGSPMQAIVSGATKVLTVPRWGWAR